MILKQLAWLYWWVHTLEPVHSAPSPWNTFFPSTLNTRKKKSFHDAHYGLAPILNTLQILTLYNPHINSIIISGLSEVYKVT